MITDTEIKTKGMTLLANGLGIVEAERFISLILREQFDYTRWRQEQWKEEPLETLFQQASDHFNQ